MPLTDGQKDYLALLPTNELIEAILDRYDDAIFAGIQDRKTGKTEDGKDEGYRVVSRRFRGDTLGCVGLSRMVGRMAEIAMEDDISPMSTDDL